jgi:hypothetical protein
MGAPLNPVPNVLKVVLEGFVDTSAADTLWANVIHFEYSGTAPSNAVCTTIASNIGTAWGTNMAPECPSPTTLQVVTVTDLTSTTSGEGEALLSHAGTRGDDSIPANAAVLISYPSTLRYKGGHPRTYLYVLGNADLSGATNWSTAGTAEVQTHWQAFLTACLGAGSGGTVLSSFCSVRYKGKFLPNGGAPHFYLTTPLVNVIPISSAIARQQMASQRGRIERRKA